MRRLVASTAAAIAALHWAAAVTMPAPTTVPARSAARKLPDTLEALAARGALTRQTVEAYYRWAASRARAAHAANDRHAELWAWLSSRRRVLRPVLVGMPEGCRQGVLACLDELRRAFGESLDGYDDLTVAFALVWGRRYPEPVRQMKWVARGRPVPPLKESFAYYLQHAAEMRFPLRATPWPLLVHVADNEVPLAERAWALEKYRGRGIDRLRRLHSDPHYVGRSKRREAKPDPNAPHSLPEILRTGGVCSHKAYYASAVLKSLGVPAVRLTGQHHAWEAWAEPAKQGYGVRRGPAIGRSGGYFNPLAAEAPSRGTKCPEHAFDMLVSAMGRGLDAYMRAIVACRLYAAVAPADRSRAAGLLRDGLRGNPFCREAWLALARACADGVLDAREGETVYASAVAALRDHPGMLYELLELVAAPRLAGAPAHSDATVRANVAALEREADRFAKTPGRLRLRAKVRMLLGGYIAQARGAAEAAQRYPAWLNQETRAYGALLGHGLKLLGGDAHRAARRRLLLEQIGGMRLSGRGLAFRARTRARRFGAAVKAAAAELKREGNRGAGKALTSLIEAKGVPVADKQRQVLAELSKHWGAEGRGR